ncbi:MAG TPA: VCBS repeat-containing protein [Balneolaceae bacterium]|nr:VCBS repeat-containing protein [Balneolaceae bacterium]
MTYRILLSASLILAALAGCSTVRQTTPESSSSFVKQVNPFPVFDEDGKKLEFPFLGGFNAPRPQFTDINGDGYPDLFVQENTDDLKYFENSGWDSDERLTWKTDKFQDLDIGEWFRFVDLDDDGDMDLLTEQPYSYIRYYRNEGSPQNPKFELAADTLRDVTGEAIFSDRQNIPNVTDIDNNGLLDLFIGRLDGTVTRYESAGFDNEMVPQFELITERFEDIEIVKQFGTLHGANTMAFMDIDSDGDQDIFWGDFFEPSILLLENRGNPTDPDFQGEPRPFPPNNPVQTSGYNAPTLVPWGDDGNIALFLGVLGGAYNANRTLAENFYFYRQNSVGNFTIQTRQFLSTLDVGNESIVATGDLNGNGKQDLLLANKIDPGERNSSLVYIYENRGTESNPEFHQSGTLDLPDAYHYAPALADLDGDGLDDLLLGRWRGGVAFYRNSGDGFEEISETLLELPRGSNAAPALADLDNDGDFDLLLGSSGGRVHYYRNEGSPSEPDFQLVDDAFQGVEVQHRSVPAFYDIDGDGDLDLFLGSKVDGIVFFENTGTASEPEFQQADLPVALHVGQFSAPHITDLDNDGKPEFLIGNREGGILFFSARQE